MTRRGSYAKGVAKRDDILRTALEVVARVGYGHATLQALADAVGLTKTGLMHYFSSKDELFAEVLRRRDELDLAAFLPDDRAADLGDAVAGAIRHNADVPGLVRLYHRFAAEASDTDHPAHGFFVERRARFCTLVEGRVRAEQAAGTLSADLDPEKLAVLTMAVADGLQGQWLLDPALDMAGTFAYFWEAATR
ncbi:TetR/AcrR family transcriptional regulator [Marmoricola sp. RAF53]|uniref:TetR/AcrR family transcriptional regulator n=1 Tax=Marmoricola sp. RAF53 TaxID=3233059 RepID=UPI003F9511B0